MCVSAARANVLAWMGRSGQHELLSHIEPILVHRPSNHTSFKFFFAPPHTIRPLMDHRKSLGKLLSSIQGNSDCVDEKSLLFIEHLQLKMISFVKWLWRGKKHTIFEINCVTRWVISCNTKIDEAKLLLFYRKRNVFPANSSTLCVNRSSAGTQLLDPWAQLNRVEPQAPIRKDVY